MRLLLGAFDVRIPIKEPINPEDILLSRDVVNEVFKSAYYEFIERRTLFGRPIIPHTIISNVKHGSLEFEVLYQIIANVPWMEVTENTELAMKQGLFYLKEIGSVAGGLYALNNVGKWIRDRLMKKEVPLEAPEKNVSVNIKSTIEINVDLFDNKERLSKLRKRLYHYDKPLSIATVVTDTETVSRIFKLTAQNIEEKRHLGGQIIVNDLNLHINGINDLNKLRKGDLLALNNYSALGMQFNSETNTVYYSASAENPDVEIQSLVMSSFETKEERQIFRGCPIDSDDLADA
jgi:hypothetical protein